MRAKRWIPSGTLRVVNKRMKYDMNNPLQQNMPICEHWIDHSMGLGLGGVVLGTKQQSQRTSTFKKPWEAAGLEQKSDYHMPNRGNNHNRHWKPINAKLAIYGDEYATPYERNAIDYEADTKFILQASMLLTILFLSNRAVFNRIANAFIPRTKSLNARLLHKFCTAGWKFVSYVGLVGMGIWALWDQQHWFWNTETYASIFYYNRIPWRVRAYYLTEISYYLFSCVSIFFEPQMKDRKQMLFHHAVTLALMISSYYEYDYQFVHFF